MASHLEVQEVLEAVVAGIPEMADYIASIPEGQKAIALDAVERHYLITVQSLGCADEPARLWVSAVMLQIRDQMEQIEEQAQTSFIGDTTEGFSLAEKCLTRAIGASALVIASPLIAFIWIGLRLERRGPAIALRRVQQGSPKAYSFVLGPGRISRYVRRDGLRTIPSLWHLLNGDSVLRLRDFSEIFQLWKATPFSR
jgi:hypothetical protein